MTGGILGGLLATWVTFTPSFIWIFMGAPYVERLRQDGRLSSALAAITAAVVGVILNLALWFALHSIFAEVRPWELSVFSLSLPVLSSIDWLALALTAAALVATLRFKTGMIATLSAAALIGALLQGLR
jgi:chromate transporter